MLHCTRHEKGVLGDGGEGESAQRTRSRIDPEVG